ncbi:hypothetical protein V8C86DRAFT_2445691, partial [Haematococcus lacustris]
MTPCTSLQCLAVGWLHHHTSLCWQWYQLWWQPLGRTRAHGFTRSHPPAGQHLAHCARAQWCRAGQQLSNAPGGTTGHGVHVSGRWLAPPPHQPLLAVVPTLVAALGPHAHLAHCARAQWCRAGQQLSNAPGGTTGHGVHVSGRWLAPPPHQPLLAVVPTLVAALGPHAHLAHCARAQWCRAGQQLSNAPGGTTGHGVHVSGRWLAPPPHQPLLAVVPTLVAALGPHAHLAHCARAQWCRAGQQLSNAPGGTTGHGVH